MCNNVSLFALLETKVKRKGLAQLYSNICSGWCISHNLAWSDSGRILIGWKQEEMSVDILVCSSQLMHLVVKPSKGTFFFCTFVYGATNKHDRQVFLNHLSKLKNFISGPWTVIGDFNCIANLNERICQIVRLSKGLPLRNYMATCEIQDMKRSGRFYTPGTTNRWGSNGFLAR